MPSEKVTRILTKRGLPDADIAAMSEAQAWDYVYATEPPKREKGLEVCFTGFADAEKAELVAMARQANMTVVTRVTVSLFILCAGPAPGAAKIKHATAQGARIVSREQLEEFIQTGEISA
ncbi:BRCT domain-containing protein [Dyella amyloliquefaciens]|uniref:BRCT domain-containing protein n=1 Tax=Dyella amyloliquefaciens TaxID=1770545 RepID=UPI00102E566A|nr:BRCT domain-containing protein [Dyella amyloliquefaciens]